MKVNQLKQIIKEAVKEGIREVLSEESTTSSSLKQNITHNPKKTKTQNNTVDFNPLSNLFEEVRKGMNPAEYKNFIEDSPNEPPAPSTEFSLENEPDFVKRAAAVFNKSINKGN